MNGGDGGLVGGHSGLTRAERGRARVEAIITVRAATTQGETWTLQKH